jgi:hypothetical protein
MRKVMVFILAASLFMGAGYAMAQAPGEVQTPKPGQAQPEGAMMGSQEMPQMMKQMQDNMQQMQQMMSKSKMTPADLKKMQDMFNQMQVMLNQMHMIGMTQMMQSCPMMKHMQTPGAQPQAPPEHPKAPEPEKK